MEQKYHNEFGNKLYEILNTRRFSQKQLSNIVEMPESKISKIITGHVVPKFTDINKICNALSVSASEFFPSSIQIPGYEKRKDIIVKDRVYQIIYLNKDLDVIMYNVAAFGESAVDIYKHYNSNKVIRTIKYHVLKGRLNLRIENKINLREGDVYSFNDKQLKTDSVIKYYPGTMINVSLKGDASGFFEGLNAGKMYSGN